MGSKRILEAELAILRRIHEPGLAMREYRNFHRLPPYDLGDEGREEPDSSAVW